MKRYLLLTIILFFGLYLTLQAQTAATNVVTNTVVEEDAYKSDCDEEEEADSTDFFTSNRKREEPLRIYPNPTTEYISVTDNSKVAYLYVYNIIGRRVKSFPVFEGGQYSLRDLPDGMYLVGMVDAQGKILKTIRTSKSMPRP